MPTAPQKAHDIAAIARQIANAIRQLPDIIQEIAGADPWPTDAEARQRLDLTGIKADSEILLRYVSRNWTLAHANALRRELYIGTEAVRTGFLTRFMYWMNRPKHEVIPAHLKQVSPVTRRDCLHVAEVLDEWAGDIESQAQSIRTQGAAGGEQAATPITPTDLIRRSVVTSRYHVSPSTLQRAIGKSIHTYRDPNGPKNTAHLYSEAEIAAQFPRRK